MVENRYHQFRIISEGPTARTLEIYMDGRRLRGVRSLDLNARTNDVIWITLEFIVGELEIDTMIEGLRGDLDDPGGTQGVLEEDNRGDREAQENELG